MPTALYISKIIEEFTPLKLQESYDNSGFVVGDPSTVVTNILVAVDVSEEVIEEAIAIGAEMIITHHPIIFNPIKRLTSSNYVERCVMLAIKNDIVLYAAHTNLDSVQNGMSWRLGEILGLKNMTVLASTAADPNVGFGVVGYLDAPQVTMEYIEYVGRQLNCSMLRYSDIVSPTCQSVAICTGSGGSLIAEVQKADVDLYVTSDLRYNDFMSPSGNFTVVDVGHYESEYCAIDILIDILSKKMINFAVHKSRCTRNPINYISL